MAGTKSCAVLDLDSTLVHIWGDETDWHFVEGEARRNAITRLVDIRFGEQFMWGTRRPYVEDFLQSCYNHFDVVGVWSAGIKPYVEEIVKEVFYNNGFTPDFVWSKNDCVRTFHEESEKTMRQKPLSKLYSAFPHIDPNRTLLFDDNEWACEQDPLNHVMVPPWCGDLETLHVEDQVLLKVARWIEQLKGEENYKMVSTKGLFA